MGKNKLKLSLIGNYLSIVKIAIFCKGSENVKAKSLISDCAFQIYILKELFCKLKMNNLALAIFEKELREGYEKAAIKFVSQQEIEEKFSCLEKIKQEISETINKLFKAKKPLKLLQKM